MNHPPSQFGPHLLGDLPDCDLERMRDGEFIYRFLLDLVKEIGMNPIGSPHLDLYTGPHREWEGFSATIHIQSRHITAHFFAFGYLFIDIFSCKPFDIDKTKQFIAHRFRPNKDATWMLISRGSNFPPQLLETPIT